MHLEMKSNPPPSIWHPVKMTLKASSVKDVSSVWFVRSQWASFEIAELGVTISADGKRRGSFSRSHIHGAWVALAEVSGSFCCWQHVGIGVQTAWDYFEKGCWVCACVSACGIGSG